MVPHTQLPASNKRWAKVCTGCDQTSSLPQCWCFLLPDLIGSSWQPHLLAESQHCQARNSQPQCAATRQQRMSEVGGVSSLCACRHVNAHAAGRSQQGVMNNTLWFCTSVHVLTGFLGGGESGEWCTLTTLPLSPDTHDSHLPEDVWQRFSAAKKPWPIRGSTGASQGWLIAAVECTVIV